jgi:hypothetical protein
MLPSGLVQPRFLPWLTDSYISNRFHARGLLITLMMEAARTSETLVNFYQTTRCYNPEEAIFVLTTVRASNRTKLRLYVNVTRLPWCWKFCVLNMILTFVVMVFNFNGHKTDLYIFIKTLMMSSDFHLKLHSFRKAVQK